MTTAVSDTIEFKMPRLQYLNKGKNMMKRLINKFIKILIELSYCNAFYMNNRKDKDVVFGLGVFAMTVMIFVNT